MGNTQAILATVGHVFDQLDQQDPDSSQRLAQVTLQAKRVFLVGAGRSGLMAKAFAMRLTHLGLKAHVAGESTTPSVQRNDAVLILSASGSTASIQAITTRIASIGATVVLLTAAKHSPIHRDCSDVIRIPCEEHPEDCGLFPLGSLFEVSSLIFLESCVAEIRKQLKVSHQEMRHRHSILE